MNLSNYYYYYTSAIPPRICDDIIRYGLSLKETTGLTGGYQKSEKTEESKKQLKQKRNSDVVWLKDNWIYKEIAPYISRANQDAGWNFDLAQPEVCQFTKYKLNQYYDWHSDSWKEPYNMEDKNDPQHNKIRKLSLTCQLTDGSEYTGGELEFDFRDYDPHMRDELQHLRECKEILPKGSIIVFPSFVWHRVKPVTSGTRYSLVIWNLGHPFR